MVVGHSGESGLTVQLLVIMELRFGNEHVQIQFRNKMANHVMVQMKIPHNAFCHTALV